MKLSKNMIGSIYDNIKPEKTNRSSIFDHVVATDYIDDLNYSPHIVDNLHVDETIKEEVITETEEPKPKKKRSRKKASKKTEGETDLEGLKNVMYRNIGSEFYYRVSTVPMKILGQYEMHYDLKDIYGLDVYIQTLENMEVDSGYITTADGTTVRNVPLETLKNIKAQMMAKYCCCHCLKQEYRNRIKNAKTKEELENLTFDWN